MYIQRILTAAVAVLLVIGFTSRQALAETRLALVVGNAAYDNVTPLDNPVNDATLMAQTLEKVGFDVTLATDTSERELSRAISAFGRELRSAGEDATGLFYYAGHGVQSFGNNYLLPVDIDLQDAADLSLVGVPAQAVLRQMFSARNRTNIVILDACRNNPFSAIPDLDDNGLAEMKAPRGTFLAYSTAPGEIAVDGAGANSPFTEALASRLTMPGVAIEALFKDVRVDVVGQTGGNQTPWDTSSLTTDFQFVRVTNPLPANIEMQQLWASVQMSRDPVQLLLFMRAHPDSPHLEEARLMLQDLMAQAIQKNQADGQAVATAKPATVDPATEERELIERARREGTAEAYREYLDAFPGGAFSELARLELETLLASDPGTDPVSHPPVPAETAALPAPASQTPETVLFDKPLGFGNPEIASRSIAELITGSPLFPPIEGLPEAAWKDQHCAACHNWEKSNLCDQASTYVANNTRALEKQHPLGGSFKDALRIWARDGCN